MNKLYWTIGMLAIVAIAAWVILCMTAAPAVTQPPNDTVTLPASGTTTTVPGGDDVPPAESYSVPLPRGGSIVTNDFIKNGETVADTVNPGSYVLAGSLGYCLADGTCPAGAASNDFAIAYSETSHAFNISLLREPLGEARRAAEQFFLDRLGITSDDACALNYYVGTSYDTNAYFSGRNLGWSFCKGATELP